MSHWVRLCSIQQAPAPGAAAEQDAAGTAICLAHVAGRLHALGNVCPHRGAPLGQGWIEEGRLVCPWHSWTFNVTDGTAEYPQGEHVPAFPLRISGDDVEIELP